MFRILEEISGEDFSGYVTFDQFKRVIELQKYGYESEDDEDTVDAFVSLGGEKNKEGNIDADTLIDIIKNKFEMTIDIEALIEEIDEDGSGEIEFDEFKKLLSSSD